MNQDFEEIENGLYISSSEAMKEAQLLWHEEDCCKNMSFDAYPYWLTDNGDARPIGFNTREELLNYVKSLSE